MTGVSADEPWVVGACAQVEGESVDAGACVMADGAFVDSGDGVAELPVDVPSD